MRIAICTQYSPKIIDYAKYTSNNHRNYCTLYGYDYIESDKTLDEERPHSWSKLKLIQQIMNNDTIEWIMWIDADAVITNKSIKIEDIINNSISNNGTTNNDINIIIIKEECCTIGELNAGVFIIRNSEWSRKFVEKWYNQTEFINHALMEQQALNYLYKNNDDVKNNIKILKQRVFNSFAHYPGREVYSEGIWKEGDFICHFAGVPNREKQIPSMAQQYT